MGALANEELRDARIHAHAAFDPVWKDERMSKAAAHEWLSQTLNISPSRCQIGMLDLDECRRVGQLVFKHYGVPNDAR